MTSHRLFMFTFVLCTIFMFFNTVSARAVNISNTWMLPEEDFPVFYRYFRDRISWYEADAVCQFHHANLVTADSSSQYDAIRAYLKELDITDNVWIGLSRKTENSDFTWSDSRILSGEGHWREPLPVGTEPLCVTMDPTDDFLWKPYTCGGPEAASFICELPVPSWALGQKGCLLTELPSLTVLYIPEQMALELTSDCGLDGTKRITCKGNANREEIIKQLACAISDEDDFGDKVIAKVSSSPVPDVSTTLDVTDIQPEESSTEFKTTTSWIWTSNAVDSYEMSTRHRRETESTSIPTESTISQKQSHVTEPISSSFMSTKSYDNPEITINDSIKEGHHESTSATIKSSSREVPFSEKNPKQDQHDVETRQDELNTTVSEDIVGVDVRVSDHLESEDIAQFPSAINQGQLFSIIENGTMFDIIELNDTGIEDVKSTKAPVHSSTKKNSIEISEKILTSSSQTTTTTFHENKDSFTTVAYYKEPPPDSIHVTNKSLKKFDKQTKTQYYKKSDPKKINFNSEKEQRMEKENKLNLLKENEQIDSDLNKEVDMFPVITSGGSLVKLNRTHRKELPFIDENEKDIFDLARENSPIHTHTNIADENKLNLFENHKHVEIRLEKKEDKNSSDIFVVTTKFLDEQLGKKNKNHDESTTTFSETRNNETQRNFVQTTTEKNKIVTSSEIPMKINMELTLSTSTSTSNIPIDPKLDELNKNIPENNESELLPPHISDIKKFENNDNPPQWEKDETLSKSLLGEIETITDDVIENNAYSSDSQNPTSEPLNSEPAGRPNRRRKLTNTQRRSFYPYFFSRVLG